MMNSEKIQDAIYTAIDEMNQQLPEPSRLIKSPQTVLVGESSQMDSLQTINLFITIEQEIEQTLQIPLDLAVGDMLGSEENDRISTVKGLVQHITGLLSHQPHAK